MKRHAIITTAVVLLLLLAVTILGRPLFSELRILSAQRASILSTPVIDASLGQQVDAEGRVYYLSDLGEFVALDKDGSELLRTKLGVGSSYLLADPGGPNFVAALDEKTKVVGPDGTVLATLERSSRGLSGLYRPVGGKLWAVNDDQEVQQFNYAGELEWKLQTGGMSFTFVMMHGDRRIFSAHDGYIYCVDGRGNVLWTELGSLTWQDDPGQSGLLLTALTREHMICRDIDGKEVWRLKSSDDLSAQMDAEGFTALADKRGISRLNREGQTVWHFPLRRSDLRIAAIGSDGCIYVMAALGEINQPGLLDRMLLRTPPSPGTYVQKRMLLAFSSEGKLLWKYAFTEDYLDAGVTALPDARMLKSEGSKLHVVGLAE